MRLAHNAATSPTRSYAPISCDDRTIAPALFSHVPCEFLSTANRTEDGALVTNNQLTVVSEGPAWHLCRSCLYKRAAIRRQSLS